MEQFPWFYKGIYKGVINNYSKENILLLIACIVSCAIMMSGYFLTETFLYGSYHTALISIYS